MAAELQQQRQGMLGNVIHAVGNDIADGDIALGAGCHINDVIPRGKSAHKARIGNIFQAGLAQGNFVEKQHIGAGRVAAKFRAAGGVVDDSFAESGNRRPVHIAGVEHLAVQNGYLHEANSC